MNKNYYVFRISKGSPSGSPESSCPIEYTEERANEIFNNADKMAKNSIPYDTNKYQDYLHNELWEHGRLRQGWGSKGLSLDVCPSKDNVCSEWIENFMIAMKRDWNHDLEKGIDYCHIASGRYNILKHMRYMKKGDILIVPRHSQGKHKDNTKFTICKVKDLYSFDVNKKYRDFGHILGVDILGSINYNSASIRALTFKPYGKAIVRIRDEELIKQIEDKI